MKKIITVIVLLCCVPLCWGQNHGFNEDDTTRLHSLRPLLVSIESNPSEVFLEFHQRMNEVSVQIYDETNRLLYTEFVGSPLQGDTYPIFIQLEPGLYYVEIRYNGNKYDGQAIWIE